MKVTIWFEISEIKSAIPDLSQLLQLVKITDQVDFTSNSIMHHPDCATTTKITESLISKMALKITEMLC